MSSDVLWAVLCIENVRVRKSLFPGTLKVVVFQSFTCFAVFRITEAETVN